MDRVKLYDNERLDIPDAQALQELVYEYVMRMAGGLMGHNSGLLTKPLLSADVTTGFITIKPCLLYKSAQTGTDESTTTGEVVRYDPSNSHQTGNATLNSVPIPTAVGAYTLHAAVTTVDTDSASRKHWDEAGSSETTTSVDTRSKSRTAFVLSQNKTESGYFPIAFVGASEDNFQVNGSYYIPTNWTYIYAWDAGLEHGDSGYRGWDYGLVADEATGTGGTGITTDAPEGLIGMLVRVRQEIAAIKDRVYPTSGNTWLSDVSNDDDASIQSLTKLKERLDTLNTNLTTTNTTLNNSSVKLEVLQSQITFLSERASVAYALVDNGIAGNYSLATNRSDGLEVVESETGTGYVTLKLKTGEDRKGKSVIVQSMSEGVTSWISHVQYDSSLEYFTQFRVNLYQVGSTNSDGIPEGAVDSDFFIVVYGSHADTTFPTDTYSV